MINRLKNTRSFYLPYLCLIAIAFSYYFYQSHGTFVIWINQLHNPIWDFFFKYWTHTGSGPFYVIVAIYLIVKKRRYGVIFSLVGITVGLVSAFFKQVLFSEVMRPSKFFEGQDKLFPIEGVNLLEYHSFPSGHTMTAFALATFLALMVQRNRYAFIFLLLATLTALSRPYIGQHFLIDIIAGSLMGTAIATIFYLGFEKYLNNEGVHEVNTPDEDLQELNLEDVEPSGDHNSI